MQDAATLLRGASRTASYAAALPAIALATNLLRMLNSSSDDPT
jgi:hypothetical protein